MSKIKFGTDGWRAIIAEDFTVENVARVAEGTALWLLKQKNNPGVILGHDCRFAGALFCNTIAKVLCAKGVSVTMSKGFVSTPMVSLGTVKENKDLGIIITASHNPPEYNGFKLKGSFGGPLLPAHVAEIEDLIPEKCTVDYSKVELEKFQSEGLLSYIDLETMYCDHVEANFDMNLIKNSGLNLKIEDNGCSVGRQERRAIFRVVSDFTSSIHSSSAEVQSNLANDEQGIAEAGVSANNRPRNLPNDPARTARFYRRG